jgi:hypothetical protein
MLIQAIARISTAKGYTHMLPEEIWAMLENQVRIVESK